MRSVAVPGGRSRSIIHRDRKVLSNSTAREYSFVYQKGQGCWVWDPDGRKYLDFAAGIAVLSAGHSNPEILRAVKRQMTRGTHAAYLDFYSEAPVRFLETLFKLTPKGMDRAFLCNSGTESVEAGFKAAKWHTNRKWFIAFDRCFHGRTMGSLSMTNSKPVQRDRFGPFLPVKHVPYPYLYRSGFSDEEELIDHCIHDLVKAIRSVKGDVAGLYAEPIQGEGGYVVPPQGFFKEVRKVCTEEDVLFCADEVQAGCFRTGTFMAMSGFGVKPDIVSMAKAIGGGFPLGVAVSSKRIMDWPDGAHSNTFGGNLVSCAAGTANLEYLKRIRAGENARKMGSYILKVLEEMKEKYSIIGDVRGKGLMIGIELVKERKKPAAHERKKIITRAFTKGLILLPAGESVIRISPPLTITKREADIGLSLLEEAIKVV